MKKAGLIVCVLFSSFFGKAQDPGSVSLNVFGGYTFQDKVHLDNYYAIVSDAFQYGGGLEYFYTRNQSIELKYLRMTADMPLYNPLGAQVNKGSEKGSVNYILVGGNSYFGGSSNGKVLPYAGAALGVGIIDGQKNSATKFAWDAKMGIKIKTASSVSLKLHAYIQSIISTFGQDYWVYPPGNVVVYNTYAALFQFGLGGAICFDFRKK